MRNLDHRLAVLSYRVSFLTPAFLGNADKKGKWRTPPFKSLLRRWWRVVYAARNDFEVDLRDMRNREGCLFGYAGGEGEGRDVGARKSRVRLRLEEWSDGKKANYNHKSNCPGRLNSHLYLGYGAIENVKGKGLKLSNPPAIGFGATNRFQMAVPESQVREFRAVMGLIHEFGTIGGRSRNGWGSIGVVADNEEERFHQNGWREFCRDWKEALKEDWPHAIGQDNQGPLVWRTEKNQEAWEGVIDDLAIVRYELRRKFPPQEKIWLAYPVKLPTDSQVRPPNKWPRLPNNLRFKIRRDESGKFYGLVFHMPCQPPPNLKSQSRLSETEQSNICSLWEKVNHSLDSCGSVRRIEGFSL